MIGKTVSHYRILERLGGGGMGVVYKAEDTRLKRAVALKFLPPELTQDSEATRRFIQEAQAASSLDHPNICTIYAIEETGDGQMFISMGCYEGRTVKEKIEEGPLEFEEAVEIAVRAAEGLGKAHSKGIIHRDVKPANIMVTGEGQVKILDFGLAKLAGQPRITKPGTTVGTVAYMSPEQVRGEGIDHRTDIWSLGIVLYEMLAGQLPWSGDNYETVLHSIFHEAPPPISSLRTDIPVALQQVLGKMMEKDVRNRYWNMEAFISDLKSVGLALSSSTFRTLEGRKPSASIAVLPFVDMSPEKDQEYFCDGMADELINVLTHIKDLRVVARTSAFSFKGKDADIREIGRRLNVDSVLEGSVRKAGNRLRITAQLVNVGDGYHLWSERYDRKLEDIFAIQDDIAGQIVNKLKVTLLREEDERLRKRRAENLEAHSLYLRGRFFWNKRTEEGLKEAIDYFRHAIEIDASYALAYSGLADALAILGQNRFLPARDTFPKAKEAAEKALEIDENLAEAHASLAMIGMDYDWDWKGAEMEFKKATALNPGYATAHHWYAFYFSRLGRHEEALREIKYATKLDPLSVRIQASLGWVLFNARRYDEAMGELRKAREHDPNDAATHWHLGKVYAQKGMYEEAIREFQQEVDLIGGQLRCALAWAYAVAERRKEAMQVVDELMELSTQRHIPPFDTALIYVGLGETDEAFAWIDKAYDNRDPHLCFCKVDPRLDPVRGDERFKDLLRKMNLED